MKRLARYCLLLLIVLPLLGNDRCVAPPTAPSKKPNILLIVGDDLSWDHHGFSGHPVVQTPSIDALAAESLVFPNAYTNASCRPTLSTLLTGQYQRQHGVTYISGPVTPDVYTIADRLGEVGYKTYHAGKFWSEFPPSRGFTAHSTPTSIVGDLTIGRRGIQDVLNWVSGTPEPWFIWFSPLMPHSPHTPPVEYIQMYEGLGLAPEALIYYAMITWFDHAVGELISALPEDTVVIYTTDNGYLPGRSPLGLPAPAPRSKGTSYEHGIRTVFLIRSPYGDPDIRLHPAHAVDITRTIAWMAGANTEGLLGYNLLQDWPIRSYVVDETWPTTASPTRIDSWVIRGRWKLVDSTNTENSRLHDLLLDPDEELNLIDDPQYEVIRDELQTTIDGTLGERE